MKPVFANSAWVAAPEAAILRHGRWTWRKLQVRYGLFIHPTAGPTLIDTGYTSHSLDAPQRTLALRCYARALAPQLVMQEQVQPFLAHYGLTVLDISRVIVTHFHADHVSGLAAFPNARFTASGAAWAQLQRNTTLQNLRQGVFTELVPQDFHLGLDAIEDSALQKNEYLPEGHDIFGDGSVQAVPLRGHAEGHFGLLFDQLDTPLLYAADVQWVCDALAPSGRPRLFPSLISKTAEAADFSSDQVEAFRKAGGTVVLCHDDVPSPFDYGQIDYGQIDYAQSPSERDAQP